MCNYLRFSRWCKIWYNCDKYSLGFYVFCVYACFYVTIKKFLIQKLPKLTAALLVVNDRKHHLCPEMCNKNKQQYIYLHCLLIDKHIYALQRVQLMGNMFPVLATRENVYCLDWPQEEISISPLATRVTTGFDHYGVSWNLAFVEN